MLQAVTDHPSPLFTAHQQGALCVTNQGTASCWLSDSTSVSPTEGIKLGPLGQVIWDATRPLYAICDIGFSTVLTVDESQSAPNPIVPHFWQTLVNLPVFGQINIVDGPIDVPEFECGHVNTLLIKLTMTTVGTTRPPGIFVTVTWKDDDGNVIDIDRMQAYHLRPASATAGYSAIRLPVVGSRVVISVDRFGDDGAGLFAVISNVTIDGSDRAFPFSVYTFTYDATIPAAIQPIIAWAPNVSVSGQSKDSWTMLNIASVRYNDPIYINQVGKYAQLTLHTSAGITAAGGRAVSTPAGAPVYFLAVGKVGAVDYSSGQALLPQKLVVQLVNALGTTGGTMDIGMSWADDAA